MLPPRIGIGDLLMVSPIFNAVSALFPGANIKVITSIPNIFDLENIETISPGEYFASDISNSLLISPTHSWRHIFYYFKCKFYVGYFFGENLQSNLFNCDASFNPVEDHYYKRVKNITDALGYSKIEYPTLVNDTVNLDSFLINRSYVCLAPYSSWPERQYPIEYWAAIIEELIINYDVVLLGGVADLEINMAKLLTRQGVINLVGKCSLRQSIYLIKNAVGFIGNDSGPSHLAFLCKTRSIVIFGCVPGDLRIPQSLEYLKKIRILGEARSCKFYPCYDGYSKPICKNPDLYFCLKSVRPHQVIQVFNQLIL